MAPQTRASADANPGGPPRAAQLPSLPQMTVSRVVGQLQSGYQYDSPWAVANVARLRREAGRDAHVSPATWGLVHLETLADLRDERRAAEQESRGAGNTAPAYLTSTAYVRREELEHREDTAVHLAVTLWALHQQSLRDTSMHVPGWTLGRAVRRLAHGGTGRHDGHLAEGGGATDSDTADLRGGAATPEPVNEVKESVRKRFVRVGSASDVEVLGTRLRELVLLLRTARIPLDYAHLAHQLLWWQDENFRDDVRRAWGRDFHRRYRPRSPGQGRNEVDPTTGPLPSSDDMDLENIDGGD
ncbi:type I-E CRISPR-associated protein Cse2/CasB [Streptomyces sp. NPDC055078]